MYYQDEFIQIDATKEWIAFFNKLSKGKVKINNKLFKSLYSFCKATGIKESEIQKLNPWINKDATNTNPEIFNTNQDSQYTSKGDKKLPKVSA